MKMNFDSVVAGKVFVVVAWLSLCHGAAGLAPPPSSWSASTFVVKACTRDQEQGSCSNCDHGQTYTEHSNGMNRCLPCTHCRTDEMETSSCTTTTDTKCQCRPGTFCVPDQACEVCKRCAKCKAGEEEVKKCTAFSNTDESGVATAEERQNDQNAGLEGGGLEAEDARPESRPLLQETQAAMMSKASPLLEDEDRGLGDSLPNTTSSSQTSLSALPNALTAAAAAATASSSSSPSSSSSCSSGGSPHHSPAPAQRLHPTAMVRDVGEEGGREGGRATLDGAGQRGRGGAGSDGKRERRRREGVGGMVRERGGGGGEGGRDGKRERRREGWEGVGGMVREREREEEEEEERGGGRDGKRERGGGGGGERGEEEEEEEEERRGWEDGKRERRREGVGGMREEEEERGGGRDGKRERRRREGVREREREGEEMD
ncbi:LOW QUALITY PROTEIN: hypothetical protein CRUP_014681 [Coryphaenoides rupestris]|nr:LOW QUALITY PROTEIN: hypothetical protein CRUP_014681 [Coryphaenoides rupestris]